MATIDNIDLTSLLWQEGSAPSTPASTKWRLYFKSGGLYIKDDAGTETGPLSTGGGSGPSIVVSAGSSVSSTSFADTDLAIAVAANTNYRILAGIGFNTNATSVGIRLAFNGPASPTLLKVGGHVPTGTGGANDTTIGSSGVTAYDTPIVTTTTGPGATNAYAILTGIFKNGANAGTLTLRHASETATATAIESGSFLELQPY